jgi:iron complex outermembrane recepter protein
MAQVSSAPAPKDAAALQATQQTAEVSDGSDAEMIVTARRRDERLLDTPVAITALSGARLAQYQVTTVSDLGTQVPSLVVGKAASGSAASIFLRGVGSSALSAGFDQSVSFVIDGLATSRGRDISLPQFDIQRVEVLKGPQALFYGKNTTGGLISIVSNGPSDHFEAGVQGGYEFNADQRFIDGYVSGPLTDTIGARFAGRYSKSDGAFVNTAADTYPAYIDDQVRTRNSDRRGFGETLGLRGTIDWQPSSNVKFELKGGYASVQDGGPTDLVERVCTGGRTEPFPANGIPASPNADCKIDGRSDQSAIPIEVAEANYRYARDGHMYSDFKSYYGILTSNITSDPFDVTSITAYYHTKQTDLNSVAGEAYPATFSELTAFSQFSEELRFQTKFSGPFNLLFGAYYAHGDLTFNTDAYIFPVPLLMSDTYVTFKRDDGFTSDSMSGFVQGTYNITSELELSGGGRYSLESRTSYQLSLPANLLFASVFPGNIRIDDHYSDNNFSPEATLRWKPSRDMMVYASYKQGFKTGGFNISQSIIVGASDATGRFASEKAKGGEIGMRSALLDGMLNLGITVYDYDYTDLQVQFYDPNTNGQIASNAGRLNTKGVELDFDARVPGVTGLRFHGAGAYNDARYHDFVGSCYAGQTPAEGCNLVFANGQFNAQNYEDRVATKAPHFSGRLGTSMDVPVSSAGMHLMLTADVSYTSRYNYSDALEPEAVQAPYAKIDASATLFAPGDRWSVSLIGRNLTNYLAVNYSSDVPFAGGTGTGTPAGIPSDINPYIENPREIFLEASVKF